MLNNPLLKGGLRPTRLIGATEEVERTGRLLSTFYAMAVETQNSPT